MSNGFLFTENPFFKHDIDKLCLICNHQFKMGQTPYSILDRLGQTQSESQMNVYDALESISNFKDIKLQQKAEKVCEFCFKNISKVIKFCNMCNKSASFLKSYIQYLEMNNILLSDTVHPVINNDRPMLTDLTGAHVLSIKPELLNEHKEQDVKMHVLPEFVTITTVDTLTRVAETTMLEKEEKKIANIEALSKVLCTKPNTVNDEVEQNVKMKMKISPEVVTIITGDCTGAMLGMEKTIIQQKAITKVETCVEELCTNGKMLNDEMQPDVKMEIWPELPTITTSGSLNCTGAMLCMEKAIIQQNEITCVEELCTNEKVLNGEIEPDVKMEIWPELPSISTSDCTAAKLDEEETIIPEISNLPEKGITNIETCLPHECKYDPLECKPFACVKCRKCFSSRKQLEQHNIIHLEVKRHECKVCGKTFQQPGKLKEHLSVHSDEKPFACEKCGKCFATRKRLKSHMTIHLEVKKHECNVCGKMFLRSSDLKEHLSVHSDENPFACDKCGKCVPSKKRLKDHMISHMEVKGHECNVCGKKFRRSFDLKLHLRLHSDEEPFVCDKCGKCVPSRKRLKDHMISHLEVKEHVCKVCGKKFLRSSVLKVHLSVHSDEKPFKCEKCGKLFAGSHHLRQHMISHSELKRHECHLCGNWYKHSHSLRIHLSNHCKGPS